MFRLTLHASATSFALLFIAHAPLVADDWPQWRGPNRDGVWREDGVVDKLPEGQIPLVWRAPISSGYSGPTVANGRVYVTDRVTTPKQAERVHCFDAKTGESLWTHNYDCIYRGIQYEAGPRASVTIDGDRAYALGAMGNFFCLAADTGEVIWARDLYDEYKIRLPIWGIAGSPLVVGSLVVVQIGGEDDACVVAFDKVTGKEAWRALSDEASYSAPIVTEHAGKTIVIVWTGAHVAGLDPDTGEVYWKHPFQPTRMVIGVATPVVHNDRVFVSSFYDGSLMLRLLPDKLDVEEVWRRLGPSERQTESLHAMIGTPIVRDDYIYGVDSYGELRCLEANTGDRVWESLDATPKARWSTIHMVEHGANVWMFNERGELIISRLTPEGFDEISRAKLIEPTQAQLPHREGGVTWAHPAYANRHVFARNDKEIVCASLAKID